MNTVLPRKSRRLMNRLSAHGLAPAFALPLVMSLTLAGCSSADAPRASATSLNAGAAVASRPDAPFVLLGEVHDNPAHHQARAERLRQLLAQEPKTVVVVEQMARDRDDAVAAARQQHPGAVDEVLEAGRFDRKGWRWPLHQPVFDVVVHSEAPLRGGNLERDQVRRIVREGDAAWPQDLLALRGHTPWADTQQQTLAREIQDGHCGAMPEAMLPGMVNAQRARDAAMAQAMLNARAQGARRVVLIAGNGHVRRDVAVPVYLQAAGVPASDIEAVAYLETDSAAGAGTYDQVQRAPAPNREDPCKNL
ncbi:Uncharacterized iron-regulated protein [Roseateles sp. YR242]|uniref:ChaN family lipoprotein n=1 Tax=Roseateles sp. YR242 TaxID=1855305 RepID=UPI0008D52859|nr:ChaN family lipoprotein [Roseateles sp. YR242]SEK55943.1 Uncharacterized iron-regulated protein [Roseateles sp. YR242]